MSHNFINGLITLIILIVTGIINVRLKEKYEYSLFVFCLIAFSIGAITAACGFNIFNLFR